MNKFVDANLKYNTVINYSDSSREKNLLLFIIWIMLKYMKDNFQKAANSYKEALKLMPEDKDAKYNLRK